MTSGESLRRALLGSLCLTWLAFAGRSPAEAAEQQPAPQRAQAAAEQSFDIPAQDLTPALIAFTEVTGIQLFFDSSLARGRQSPGVTGRLPAEEALRRLLSGTGMTYRFTNPRTVTLEQAGGTGAAVTLDPVRVEAEGELAGGPVEGYVAPRSASGTKDDAPLLETPQAISVVTSDQIRDRGATTVTEAVRYAPGVRADTFGADPRNDWFLIRGYTAQENGYFLDGLQLQSSAFATWRVDPYVLERIDVVRGPSAALYGATNPGGLLNAVTKRPVAGGSFGEVFSGINNHGNARGGFDVNESAGDFALRLTGIGNFGEAEVDHVDDDGFTLAPSLLWTPNDDTSLTAYAYVSKERTNSQNFLPYEGTVSDAPFGRIDRDLFTSEPELDRFDRDQWMVGYDLEHAVNDRLTLRQKARYAELSVDFQALYGGGYAVPPTADTALMNRYNFLTQPNASELTLDNQVHFDAETGPLGHELLAGFDYKRYRLEDEQGFEFGSPLDLLDPVYLGAEPVASRYNLDETTQNQYGFYLQDRISFDRLHFLLSGRYDHVTSDVHSDLTGANTDATDNEFSWRAGAIYVFDSGFAPYASVTRSFLPVAGTNSETGQPFEPETGLQYEAGLKFQPQAWGDSYLAVSAFHLVRENVTQSDNLAVTRQVGEVTTKGLELEAVADPLPGLSLTASASFYDIEITDGTELDKGNRPTATPETMASVYADYTLQAGTLAGLGFGAGVRYAGSSFADRANSAEVPSATLVDMGIHYQLGGVRAAVTASNLLDEEYVAGCSDLNSCFYGEGREVMFTLGYSW